MHGSTPARNSATGTKTESARLLTSQVRTKFQEPNSNSPASWNLVLGIWNLGWSGGLTWIASYSYSYSYSYSAFPPRGFRSYQLYRVCGQVNLRGLAPKEWSQGGLH